MHLAQVPKIKKGTDEKVRELHLQSAEKKPNSHSRETYHQLQRFRKC